MKDDSEGDIGGAGKGDVEDDDKGRLLKQTLDA